MLQEGAIEAMVLEFLQQRWLFVSANVINHHPLRCLDGETSTLLLPALEPAASPWGAPLHWGCS